MTKDIMGDKDDMISEKEISLKDSDELDEF
jgi:hypothetical protein